ncbi:MAG: AAA family ATPase [Candidatus Heimdallarchaeaceae archaeon]
MIINFTVSNYKSIKDGVTLSFVASKSDDMEKHYVRNTVKNLRLLKLGMIYGPNASGKTTLLEALDFLRNISINPFATKTELFGFEPFLFDGVSRTANTTFSLELISNEAKYSYNLELNRKCVVNESLDFYQPNKALVFKRITDIDNQLVKIVFGSKIQIPAESRKALIGNTLWNNTVIGAYLKTNIISQELQDVVDWFSSTLKPIITPKSDLMGFLFDKFEKSEDDREIQLRILNKAGFDISDIHYKSDQLDVNEELVDIISRNSIVPVAELEKIKKKGKIDIKEVLIQHTVDDEDYLLPIESESSGTKRYFELGGILATLLRQNSVISIDELEASLHPDLLKHFLLTFLMNSQQSQLIVTTHMRELLMEKDVLRKDVIWFTEKKEDSSTDLFNLTDFDTSVVRNTSSLYNAYKIGKLGAVPCVGDYYIGINYED